MGGKHAEVQRVADGVGHKTHDIDKNVLFVTFSFLPLVTRLNLHVINLHITLAN